MATLILLVAMFALLWLLLIRPQRQRQQTQKRLLDSVEPGDEVLYPNPGFPIYWSLIAHFDGRPVPYGYH